MPTVSTKRPLSPLLTPRIVFEDPHLLVIEKPAGLLSQGDSSEEPHLVDWAREHVGRHYVGLVHRLDRNTSGLMVLAKRSKAADRLSHAIREGSLERRYQAWCLGDFPVGVTRTWKHELSKDSDANQVRVVTTPTAGTQTAITHVVGIEHARLPQSIVSKLGFQLETGRSHQIRIQAATMGYPILGDRKYGGTKAGHLATRTALHSSYLKLPHPIGGESLTFESPIPALELFLP